MITIRINGKTIKQWFVERRKKKLMEEFAQRIPKGHMVVVWRDIDNMVYGWGMSADEEANLVGAAKLIIQAKYDKLVATVYGKEDDDGEG